MSIGFGYSYVPCGGLAIIDRLLQQETEKMWRVSINRDREEGRQDLCHKDTIQHAAVVLPESSVG